MSIKIREDKDFVSKTDLLSIEKGVAQLGIYAIRLSVIYTEEQIQENLRISKILAPEQWTARCEQSHKKQGQRIEKLVDAIANNFTIYQYKNKTINYSKDDWDLFFWCNTGDMSYVTLNPNEKRTMDQQIIDITNVLDLLKTIECEDGIELAIQYTTEYDQTKVKEIASAYFQTIKDTFIYSGYSTGKIKEIGIGYDGCMSYGFFRKGASKKYRPVSDISLMERALSI